MITKVKVTQFHINTGEKEDCHSCPVALALSETFPEYVFEVHRNDITINGEYWEMLTSIRVFIDAFDKELEVEPVEFEIDI